MVDMILDLIYRRNPELMFLLKGDWGAAVVNPLELTVKSSVNDLGNQNREVVRSGYAGHTAKHTWASYYPQGYPGEGRVTSKYHGSKTHTAWRIYGQRASRKRAATVISIPHSVSRRNTHRQPIERRKYSSIFR